MFIKRKIKILTRKKSILKANNVTENDKNKRIIEKLSIKWRKELRLPSVFYNLRNSVS